MTADVPGTDPSKLPPFAYTTSPEFPEVLDQLAADGITSGCGGGNYCPTNNVTRAEMAVFLVNAFNLPL